MNNKPTKQRVMLILGTAVMLMICIACPVSAANVVGTKIISKIVKDVGPSVVNVDTFVERTVATYRGFGDPYIDQFFGNIFGNNNSDWEFNNVFPQKGTGSGVIVDERGLVVTNYHVIAGSDKIQVRFDNEHRVDARVVATDPLSDLALIAFEADEAENVGFKAAELGTLKGLEVGDWAVAIGNPFGLDRTVTVGVISAMERTIPLDRGRVIRGLIQTDAAINFGNSGGPLLDMKGKVIGINTAIIPNAQGIGFSVDVDRVKSFIAQVAKYGKPKPPQLGVSVQGLTRNSAARLKIQGGILVRTVQKDAPAGRAGVKEGDVIISYADQQIISVEQFVALVKGSRWGETVRVRLIRDGEPVELFVEFMENTSDQKEDSGENGWNFWNW